MDNWIAEPGVAVMFPIKCVMVGANCEFGTLGVRVMRPHKAASLHRLVLPIHSDCVMRPGSPEVGAPLGLTMVGVGTWIYKKLPTRHRQVDRQSVRMTVSCNTQVAEWPGVNKQADFILCVEVLPKDKVASLWELPPDVGRDIISFG